MEETNQQQLRERLDLQDWWYYNGRVIGEYEELHRDMERYSLTIADAYNHFDRYNSKYIKILEKYLGIVIREVKLEGKPENIKQIEMNFDKKTKRRKLL